MTDSSLDRQETVVRRVNEAIERGFWPGDVEAVVRMRCECGRDECADFVRMRVADYERLRDHPRRFVLCAGHDTPAIERVVGERDGYVIVEKTGAAGSVAEDSDPRRGVRDPGETSP